MAQTPQRSEYVQRINRVLDYIDRHLSEELSLNKLAQVAYFSPFHFHRIFSAFQGETINQFIQRIRLERAATALLSNTERPVTDIALDTGFSSSSSFARAFRDMYGMSASEWRAGGAKRYSKNRQTNGKHEQMMSKGRKAVIHFRFYVDPRNGNQSWRSNMPNTSEFLNAEVEVREMPEWTVAYLRHTGPYAGDSELFGRLITKLMTWAGPRGLYRPPETQMLFIYHDDPSLTDESKLRTSICITVPEDTEVSGDIGKMNIPGGRFAVGHFEITAEEYGAAWNSVYGGWLPESGYQPDDRLPYEMMLNNPEEHPEGKHEINICVPVKPL